jgi:hypothetical protein
MMLKMATYSSNSLDFASLIEPVSRKLFGEPNRKLSARDELRFGGRGSLAVAIGGHKAGCWHNHETGTGGGVLDLIRAATGRDDGIVWLREFGFLDGSHCPGFCPNQPPATAQNRRNDDAGSSRLARQIWDEAIGSIGTLVETYLASRGLTLPPGAPIRFHPACPRGTDRLPAMISLMTDPVTASPCGAHRTFLRLDGSGKADGQAKMMLGNAGVIRLVPDDEIATGLGLAEGVETALAVMQRASWSPIWAACSAGGIAKFPVLCGIEAITIFADADDKGAGLRSSHECANRWRAAGREAHVSKPPIGTDWLDALNRSAA